MRKLSWFSSVVLAGMAGGGCHAIVGEPIDHEASGPDAAASQTEATGGASSVSASGGATSAGGATLLGPAAQNALVDQSTDPYACAYISYDTAVGNPTSPTGDPINPYMTDADGMGYASVCKRTGRTCWLTGPLQWEAEQLPRDGFLYNPATGLMEGGQYSVCEYNCDVDDCPQPTTGTARAQCGFPEVPDYHVCVIACGNGETCPDGFLCIQPGLSIGAIRVPRQCVEYKYQSVTRQNVPP